MSFARIAAGLASPLAYRVVRSSVAPSVTTAVHHRGMLTVPRTRRTAAPGVYGFRLEGEASSMVLIGDVLRSDRRRVTRQVLDTGSLPDGVVRGQFSGDVFGHPRAISEDASVVTIRSGPGGTRPLAAWLVPGLQRRDLWTIHVQGLRSHRAGTLRSVSAAHGAGATSLVVTFHGAADGPPTRVSTLGQREWRDVGAAVDYALAHGASRIVLVGWSMGAGIALEVARNRPEIIDSLILVSPATNWTRIIEHALGCYGVPRFVATATRAALSDPSISKRVGLVEPLDFSRLDWSSPGSLTVPALVIHSAGDELIPWSVTREFASAHSDVVKLVETNPAPHGREANVDPALFRSEIMSWLIERHTNRDLGRSMHAEST